MPLNTVITRSTGEVAELRWTDFHVAAMILASTYDAGPAALAKLFTKVPEIDLTNPEEPFVISPSDAFGMANYMVIGMSPLNSQSYTIQRGPYYFRDGMGQVDDLVLNPGDVLDAWRSY